MKWDGKNQEFKFEQSGEVDLNYATCIDIRSVVSRIMVKYEDIVIAVKDSSTIYY